MHAILVTMAMALCQFDLDPMHKSCQLLGMMCAFPVTHFCATSFVCIFILVCVHGVDLLSVCFLNCMQTNLAI